MVNNLSNFFNTLNIYVTQGSILGPLLFLILLNYNFKSNACWTFSFLTIQLHWKKVQAFYNFFSFGNLECSWEPINLQLILKRWNMIVFHPKQKKVEDFQFIFNCNDLNSFTDPRCIVVFCELNVSLLCSSSSTFSLYFLLKKVCQNYL